MCVYIYIYICIYIGRLSSASGGPEEREDAGPLSPRQGISNVLSLPLSIYIYTYMYIYIYMYVYVCIYIYIYMCIYIYIYDLFVVCLIDSRSFPLARLPDVCSGGGQGDPPEALNGLTCNPLSLSW